MTHRRRGWSAWAALLAVALVAGCASMSETTDWKGKPISDAMAKFGTPSRIKPGENGQQIYVWMIHRHTMIANTVLAPNGAPMDADIPHDSVVTWTFIVDQTGTIISFARSET